MKALQENGQVCTRMGAYKPRTSPYSFQGHGKNCLPYVFELAGKYGIKVIAMEVTHESHVDEINEALEQTGNPTGVMLQIGTRNTQNFELLKSVGRQQEFPVLAQTRFRHHARRIAARRRIPGERGQSKSRFRPARNENEHRRPAPEYGRFRAYSGRQTADADAGLHRSVALGRRRVSRAPTIFSTLCTSRRRA